MAALRTASLLACLLVLAPSVSAQGFKWFGDSRVIADLAVWFVADIANYIIAMLCILPLQRKEHMSTYAALMTASSFTVIQATVNIGYIFSIHNLEHRPSLQEQVSLLDTSTFFGFWSSPFLYLTIVFLLYDRAKHVSRGSLARYESMLFTSAFAYFGVLLLVATVAFGLYARALALEKNYESLGRHATIEDFNAALAAGQRATNASFAFSGFWYFSTVVITALAISTYVRANRLGVLDKIIRIVLILVVPLYYGAMIVGIVFTIFASPSIQISSRTVIENINLASDLLTQLLYTSIMAVLIILPFKRKLWNTSEQAVALSTLGAMPSGGYVELDDPRK